jgi:hypothetical protein
MSLGFQVFVPIWATRIGDSNKAFQLVWQDPIQEIGGVVRHERYQRNFKVSRNTVLAQVLLLSDWVG